MRMTKAFLFLVLAAWVTLSAAAPILEASTEISSPGARKPPPGMVEAMLKAGDQSDLESLTDCAKEKGLSAQSLRSLFKAVALPRLTPTEQIYFLRPALAPYCFTFYGAHLFRYWLIAERGTAQSKSFSILWVGAADSFKVMPLVTNGKYEIAQTNCNASSCHTRNLRFDGQAYADYHCSEAANDEQGRTTVHDEPCS